MPHSIACARCGDKSESEFWLDYETDEMVSVELCVTREDRLGMKIYLSMTLCPECLSLALDRRSVDKAVDEQIKRVCMEGF